MQSVAAPVSNGQLGVAFTVTPGLKVGDTVVYWFAQRQRCWTTRQNHDSGLLAANMIRGYFS